MPAASSSPTDPSPDDKHAAGESAAAPAPFGFKPLLMASMACTMTMMAFIALIGSIARSLDLPPWQAGMAVTVGGVLWMLLARVWGAASDRRGRRAILLAGVGGFTLSYWAMCALLIVSLQILPAAVLVFMGLLITRGAVGGFYAAIPSTGQALIADHVAPARRAGAMASLGAANAVGMVIGPALAGGLARFGLALPLFVTAVLPAAAFALLWRALPRHAPPQAAHTSTLAWSDRRLRRAMAVGFAAMFCVAVAQITVGFLTIDQLGLAAGPAAQAAGVALTAVGVALIGAQLLVKRLGWTPQQLIRRGALIAAVGFGSVVWVRSTETLALCFFIAAAGMGWVFPAFAALAANAVQPHEQGAAAGTLGAAQGLGIVLGPLAGAALYGAGPSVPYLMLALLLAGVAVWGGRASAPIA
ncbi:MAG: MFS transporter [Burkholderiaceae bacterium]